mgnify:CR=1 FL=1
MLFYQELVVALYGLVVQFETNFGVVALQFLEEDRQKENGPSAAAWISIFVFNIPKQPKSRKRNIM